MWFLLGFFRMFWTHWTILKPHYKVHCNFFFRRKGIQTWLEPGILASRWQCSLKAICQITMSPSIICPRKLKKKRWQNTSGWGALSIHFNIQQTLPVICFLVSKSLVCFSTCSSRGTPLSSATSNLLSLSSKTKFLKAPHAALWISSFWTFRRCRSLGMPWSW